MFYRSPRFILLGLLWLVGCQIGTWAGEAENQFVSVAKPFMQPLMPTNSTFRSDLRLPHPKNTAVHQGELGIRQIAKTCSLQSSPDRSLWRAAQSPQAATAVTPPTNPNDPQLSPPPDSLKFQWKSALAQSMTFLWIEHTFRFMTEAGTRAELRGPFFKDWFTSVRRTRGWRDGDPFIVNYIGHPMQGSVTNYIYVHNDPRSRVLEAGFSKAYFKSRLKAMLFSTIYSTQFELGPLSEASLGNVGIRPSRTSRHPSAFVDLVVMPTLGTVWTMGEDALDKWVVKRLENRVENRFVRLMVRGFLAPSRSFANVLRGRYPWHRDGRRL
jgi:hypothetical protein